MINMMIFLFIFFNTQSLSFCATKDEAEKELNLLIEDTLELTQRAAAYLNDNYLEALRYFYNNFTIVVVDKITEESSTFLKEIQKIKDSVDAKAVNITNCTRFKETAIEDITNFAKTEFTNCTRNNYQQGLTVINQGLGNLNTIVTDVTIWQKKLDECLPVSTCVDNVLYNVKTLEEDVPRRIKVELTYSRDSVEVIGIYIYQICGLSRIEEFLNRGNAVIDEIRKCVGDIVDKTTTKSM